MLKISVLLTVSLFPEFLNSSGWKAADFTTFQRNLCKYLTIITVKKSNHFSYISVECLIFKFVPIALCSVTAMRRPWLRRAWLCTLYSAHQIFMHIDKICPEPSLHQLEQSISLSFLSNSGSFNL